MQQSRTGDLKLIQELNRSIILNMIRINGPISRSELAKRNKLSPSTVASAVNELLQAGLVYENGRGSSSGGRKPIMVSFSPNNHFLVGIVVSNFGITIAEINMEATIRRSIKITPMEGSFFGENVIAIILDSLEKFLLDCELDKCVGISIIVPGIVDARLGIIHYNSKLKLESVPIKEVIESRFQLKTWIENDMNAIVLAEKRFGDFSKYQNLIYILVGGGVGSGVIINDSVLRGSRGGAGEFGHTSVDRTGIPCECGNRGCIENYISWPAIRSRIMERVKTDHSSETKDGWLHDLKAAEITPDDFLGAVEAGDALANTIMEDIVTYMGVGLVNLVNMFNPDIIILGGEMIGSKGILLGRLKEYIKRHALGFSTEGLQIYSSSLGDNAPLVGAASVLLEEYFRFSLVAQP
jgi:predicted NBD/HSP70 family sugar kinase